MPNQYQPCTVSGCNKLRQHSSGIYCVMHLARFRRNGTILTQKEMGIVYNKKLGTLNQDQLDYIKKHSDDMTDVEMAQKLGVSRHHVMYGRRKIWGRKYKGNNKRTYLKLKYRALKNDTCEVCGWNEAPCDIHHRTPLSKGGKDSFDNFICLCPNHHRTFHYPNTKSDVPRDIS